MWKLLGATNSIKKKKKRDMIIKRFLCITLGDTEVQRACFSGDLVSSFHARGKLV